MTTKKQTFENALNQLEEVALNLEDGNLSLDKSIEQYELGMKLSKFCHSKLQEAEQKIQILQKQDKDQVKLKKIKINKNTGEIDEDQNIQGTLL